MTTYTVTLTVELDRPINDATARDLAARWAAAWRWDLRLTSVDETRLTVHALVERADDADLFAPPVMGAHAQRLANELQEIGYHVTQWHAVEVVSAAEHARRDAAASLSEARG